ncbi:MAG: S-layer homology domain-containing protein [Candidatus Gracilibacteria bacterium]
MRIFTRAVLPLLLLTLYLTPQAQAFTDVPVFHTYGEAIASLSSQKIINGYADGTFKPMQNVNRAEFIKIIVSSKYGTPTSFTEGCFKDVPKKSWYESYVCYAKSRGIVSGYQDGTFKPEQPIAASEAFKIVVSAYELGIKADPAAAWYIPYTKTLAAAKYIPDSLFSLSQKMRRGEVAELIWRIINQKTTLPSKTVEQMRNQDCIPRGENMPSNIDMVKIRSTWLQWYNDKRKAAGLKPYVYNAQLDRTAYIWSEYARSKGSITHVRPGTTAYYDYSAIKKWFKNLGLTFKLESGRDFVENIGWGVYRCSHSDCNDKLLASIKTTFDFFYGEKNKSYRPHYDSMMSSVYDEIGIGIAIDATSGKYYMTVHYGTSITSNPTQICEAL